MIRSDNFLLIPFLIFVGLSNFSIAQNSQLLNQSMYYLQADNPAFAGSWDQFGVTATGNRRYLSSFGSPTTYSIAMHSPIVNPKSGIGLAISNEHFLVVNNFTALADYSYKFALTPEVSLRIGLRGGLTNYQLNMSSIVFAGDDLTTPNSDMNSTIFNIGAGAFLQSKQYYLGVALPKFLRQQFDGDSLSTGQNIIALNGGYIWRVNEILRIVPSLNLQYIGESGLTSDININFLLYRRLGIAGFTQYGDEQSVGANFNFMVNAHLMLGYSYKHFISSQGLALNSDSHGLVVSYCGYISKRRRISSPRYF